MTLTRRAPAYACLIVLVLATPAVIAPGEVDDFLEHIRQQEPLGPSAGATPTGGSAPVTFSNETSSSFTTQPDEATTLHAIALARREGLDLTLSDVGRTQTEHARRAVNDQLPPPGPLLDALTLGTFNSPLVGLIFELLVPFVAFELPIPKLPLALLQLRDQAFVERSVQVSNSSLGEQETLSALVLMASGVPFHARDAFTTSQSNDRETTFDHRPVVSTAVAAAFAVLGVRLAGSINLDELHQATLRDAHHTETTRVVEIPERVALAAAAVYGAGIPVNGTDVLSMNEVTRDERVQVTDTLIERGNLLSALLLR